MMLAKEKGVALGSSATSGERDDMVSVVTWALTPRFAARPSVSLLNVGYVAVPVGPIRIALNLGDTGRGMPMKRLEAHGRENSTAMW